MIISKINNSMNIFGVLLITFRSTYIYYVIEIYDNYKTMIIRAIYL